MVAPTLPRAAIDWLASAVPAPIAECGPIGGGITNTKWVVRVTDGRSFVLRWEDPVVWGALGQDHVRREALACRVLADSAVPLPDLLALDSEGEAAGGPANLMTWLPGRARLDPPGPRALDALARAVVAVHRQPVAPELRPPVFGYRGSERPEVPGWTRRPDLWRRAIDIRLAAPPSTAHVLIHRDFHLGNVLWDGDILSGVVDWADLSWGPADLDVAHMCSDFAMLHDVADASAFRSAYLRHGGVLDPDPDAWRYWVVSDALGFLPDPAHILPGLAASRPDLDAEAVRTGLEELLAHTLA